MFVATPAATSAKLRSSGTDSPSPGDRRRSAGGEVTLMPRLRSLARRPGLVGTINLAHLTELGDALTCLGPFFTRKSFRSSGTPATLPELKYFHPPVDRFPPAPQTAAPGP